MHLLEILSIVPALAVSVAMILVGRSETSRNTNL